MGDLWRRYNAMALDLFLYDRDEEGNVVGVDDLKMEKMGFTIISLEVALSFYETVMETNMVARKFYLRKLQVFGEGRMRNCCYRCQEVA